VVVVLAVLGLSAFRAKFLVLLGLLVMDQRQGRAGIISLVEQQEEEHHQAPMVVALLGMVDLV
jgi:hypothetical protein